MTRIILKIILDFNFSIINDETFMLSDFFIQYSLNNYILVLNFSIFFTRRTKEKYFLTSRFNSFLISNLFDDKFYSRYIIKLLDLTYAVRLTRL